MQGKMRYGREINRVGVGGRDDVAAEKAEVGGLAGLGLAVSGRPSSTTAAGRQEAEKLTKTSRFPCI